MARKPHDHCPECGGGRRDLRGPIALLGILLTFALAFAQLFLGFEEGATIPPWAAAFLTLVVQAYYMTKGAERHAEALRRRGRRKESGDKPEG